MSINAVLWAFDAECPSAQSRHLLLELANKANLDGICWPSVGTLAEITMMCANSVRKALRELVGANLLAIQPIYDGRQWRSNRYALACGGTARDEVPMREMPYKVVGGTAQNEVGVPHPVDQGTSSDEVGVPHHVQQGTAPDEANPVKIEPVKIEPVKRTKEESLSPDGESPEMPRRIAEQMVDIWHEVVCPPLSRVAKLTKPRIAAAYARFVNDCNRSLDEWRNVLQHVRESAFLTGENKTGWKADFDFCIRESSFVKIEEGKYDDRESFNGKSSDDDQQSLFGEQKLTGLPAVYCRLREKYDRAGMD